MLTKDIIAQKKVDAIERFLEKNPGSSRNLAKGIPPKKDPPELQDISTHRVFSFTAIKDNSGNHIRLYIKGAWARLDKAYCIVDIVAKTVVVPIVYAKSMGLVE